MSGQLVFAFLANLRVLNRLLALWVHGLLLLAEFIEPVSDLTTERFHRPHHSLIDVSVASIAVVPKIHSKDCPAAGWVSAYFARFVLHFAPPETTNHNRA
jgi:hypothetical protein